MTGTSEPERGRPFPGDHRFFARIPLGSGGELCQIDGRE